MSTRDRLEPKILHEDNDLLVIDKPGGLLVHGAEDVESALAWARRREAARGGDPDNIDLIHRLDRDTSGVLLFGRNAQTVSRMGEAFRDRKVLKLYLALTSPVPALRWLRVEQRLRARRLGGGEFMEVVQDGGVEAFSEIEVLSRGRRFGLVRVIPEQGRKHQVRVALAATGSPICGDFLYGGAIVARLAKRVMLHARRLEFAHPTTGEHVVFKAALPQDFRDLIAEDGGSIPPDLDRRHRTEPRGGRKAAEAAPNLAASARVQGARIETPRHASTWRRPTNKPKT
jgi:RluA family pseudouridine synthase